MKWIGTRDFAHGSSVQVWRGERAIFLRFHKPGAAFCSYEIAIPADDAAAVAALLTRGSRSFDTNTNPSPIDPRTSP